MLVLEMEHADGMGASFEGFCRAGGSDARWYAGRRMRGRDLVLLSTGVSNLRDDGEGGSCRLAIANVWLVTEPLLVKAVSSVEREWAGWSRRGVWKFLLSFLLCPNAELECPTYFGRVFRCWRRDLSSKVGNRGRVAKASVECDGVTVGDDEPRCSSRCQANQP
jgi:hypothetical protein